LRQAAAKVRGLEDVFEDTFDIDPGTFIRVDAERTEAKVQRPDVIKTKDVIRMTVSDQNCVEMLQAVAQSLLTKVGGCVDQHSATGMFDNDRNS
jgi:hypothetical protein